MLQAALVASITAFLTTLWFVASRRRHTRLLDLAVDDLPRIHDGLPALTGLTGSAVYRGNAVEVIQNGAIFDRMEADIRAARHNIHLETFVWTRGKLAWRFVELLCAKAAEGRTVRVIVDAAGAAGADPDTFRRLKQGRVHIVIYRPFWRRNLRRLNHRTHRKLLVVDGTIGYTFGHGFADTWLGNGDGPDHWRDTGVRMTGPVVQALQSIFLQHWMEATHEVPCEQTCFPAIEPCGEVDAHVVSSGAGDAVSSVAVLYSVAIGCAREEVLIQNPYFVPGRSVVRLLETMVRRGVRVRVMVPGRRSDNRFVRHAGCYLYAGLMKAGIELYEYELTTLHQKVAVVDGVWAHVGSTNLDARSLALNEEASLGVLDAGIAKTLKEAFEEDLRNATRMDPAKWSGRAWWRRITEWSAYQMHEQL